VEAAYFLQLVSFFGQTAQLTAGSATGLSFPEYIVGVKEKQVLLGSLGRTREGKSCSEQALQKKEDHETSHYILSP
jgi:hypothetical protein